jgi:hypothetical protein
MSLPPALQNKNVQIAVIAVAVLIALVALFAQMMGSNASPPPEAYMSPGVGPYPGGTGPGGPGPGGPMMGSGYPGPGGSGGPPGVMGYGSDTSGGGAPLTGAGGKQAVKKAGPRPPTRKDPFKTPTELIPEPTPIAASLPANNQYIDARIQEISTPTPDQFIRDTPDPPMRMAGALWGNRVYGVLEINGQTQVVNPGDKVGIYRVERVERDRIVLSRPARHGRRTVEALLAGNPALAAQYPTGDNGIPGGPTGYGGPPGYAAPGGSGGPAGSAGK